MTASLREHNEVWRAERIKAQADAAAESTPPAAEAPPELVEKEAAGVVFKSAYVGDGGVIYAIAATSGTVDLDDDVLSTEALVKMAYDFTSSGTRTFKANHSDAVEADLVASITGAPVLKSGRVIAHGESLPEDDPMVGINLEEHPSAWVVGIRPKDRAIAELAKAGGIAGLSWGAYATRSPIKE
jgi:hypothetical protein